MLTAARKQALTLLQWASRSPAYQLLTAGDEAIAAEPPLRFSQAWAGLVAISIAWGVLSVGIFIAAWNIFGEPFGRFMPALAVVAAGLAWPFRRAISAAIGLLAGPDPTARSIAACLWVLMLVGGLGAIHRVYRPEAPMPDWIAWIRPWEKLYRIPILMPLWGCWAMLITPQFCRANSQTSPAVAAFARGCGALTAAIVMGCLLALTVNYFGHLPWEQLAISGVTILTAIVSGQLFCLLEGGLTRRALLAANVTTQLALLLSYLAAQNLLLW